MQESTQNSLKTVSKQIPNSESIEMKTEVKTEVKTERFEDFEVHEQVGIDHITSKDFDHPFIKSDTSWMKTEFKAEVKEEAFEEFDTQEQIGMDIITSRHFENLSNMSDHTPRHESLPEKDQSEVVDEHEANNDHEFPNQGARFVEVEDPAKLIDQSDYSLDGNQSGEAMVYEGDPENPGVS